MEIARLSRDKLTDAAMGEIEQMIMRGDIAPGDWLPPQPELARRFGVGLSTVREAVRGLTLLGILEPQAGRGTQVNPEAVRLLLMIDMLRTLVEELDALKIYEARRPIEMEISGLAAERATAEDVARIEAAVEAMAQGIADNEAYAKADLAYHMAVAQTARNPVLEQFNRLIWEMQGDVPHKIIAVPGYKEHGLQLQRQVLEAIRAHDPKKARRYAEQIIVYSEKLLRTFVLMAGNKEE